MGSRLAFHSRTVRVSGPGIPKIFGQPALVFSKLSGTEGINGLFRYELELRTPDSRNLLHGPAADLDLESMQGKELTIEIELDGKGLGLDGGFGRGTREISGIVTEIHGPIPVDDKLLYRVTLRPWLYLASLNKDYRIFQRKNVVEIAQEVLSEYTFPVENRLIGAVGPQYPMREYQVQYGESDYQFVRRILAEWGISFFFEHSDGHHRMVLTDGNGAFRNFTSPAYHAISWYPSSDRMDEEHLHQFEVIDRLVAGKYTHVDYDHGKPRADLTVSLADPRKTSHADQEVYEWPGDYSQPKTGNDPWKEGDMLGRIRMEAIRQHGLRVRGAGNVRALVPGCRFTLARFLRKKANREYVVYATRLLIEDVGERAGADRRWHCEVEFEAQPSSELLRPELVEKPSVHGTLMARVVGPDNQEIWCDDMGRVKVHFPWDRKGQANENSSVYLRTAEAASGEQFGSQFVPRIGQEVIVGFVGGDPDRPYIVGPANNQINSPPWSLPSQHALSGYASKEHYAHGRNHLLFDDTQAQQQVQLASDHKNSLLALGHNVRVPNVEGRKDKRGEGFELRTDAHGAVRAALGLLVTTFSRLSAQGNAMNVRDVVQLLEKAQDIAANLGEKAAEAKAQDGEQSNVARKLEVQAEQVKGGGELKEFTAPHLVSASPAGIVSTAAGSTHIASGGDTALTTGEHLSVATGGGFFASVRKALRLFAYEAGMKLVANMGDIDLQALKDNINLLAKLKITLTADEITIQAKQKLLLAGGGSYLRLDGNIEHGTNGTFTVHAASKLLTGPNSIPTELATRQVCLECLLKAARRNTGLLLR
ncbi:type VI secretion system Vgr family protein [Cupriavidus oxalaticus]|uniref:type VI secretion system Vgr family protein n=1 Tax=Cupriavidus oxalaticus TaxID=96344 RepID=UPI00317F4F3E